MKIPPQPPTPPEPASLIGFSASTERDYQGPQVPYA